MFTNIADDMFGDGRLTREERIALSGGIGSALDAFRATLEERAAGLYSRDPYRDPASPAPVDMGEASIRTDEEIELVESAIRRDGTIFGKIIQPGWGSTGYYPADVLERDGAQVYRAGTHMYWNHATATEEAERPEGDLNTLAAVLTTNAQWLANGPKGPGLYANAKVFSDYADKINEKAEFTGLSIRGGGSFRFGEADGREGRIITAIKRADSIDFVTKAGAGGHVVLMESQPAPQWTEEEQTDMDELKEALALVETQKAQIARLTEGLILREAKDIATTELAKSTLPAVTQTRLATTLAANPPVADGALDKAAYATKIAEAIADETAYLQQVAGFGNGRVEGMGTTSTTTTTDAPDHTKRMVESFKALGMSDKEAAVAAAGRLH